MKRNALIISAYLLIILIGVGSCEKGDDEGNESMVSMNYETESHNAGKDCMDCHKSGGSGEGWFTVAGTVYDNEKTSTYPNALIRLKTGPDGSGEIIKEIEVDGLGNFYTTQNINFGDGLYVEVIGNENTKAMGSKINNGRCNSCHGASIEKIWVK